ncbi:MAG: methyltransferase domain-containing protein [Ferruginibacter sp.]
MTDVHINIKDKPASAASNDAFEKMYLSIREKEKRVYTDEEVAVLPQIASSHIHYKEWLVRKRSANRLLSYLKKKKGPVSLLEVGCGNGWLIAKMATIPQSHAVGIDINNFELEQARRVFRGKNNLVFLQTDLDQVKLKDERFDVILFAASISYFNSLENTVSKALSLLNENGEIHIVDNFLYKRSEIQGAKKRAYDYCKSLGHADMAGHYFHHCIESLNQFNHKILFDPSTLENKIFGNRDPFPWVCITK